MGYLIEEEGILDPTASGWSWLLATVPFREGEYLGPSLLYSSLCDYVILDTTATSQGIIFLLEASCNSSNHWHS